MSSLTLLKTLSISTALLSAGSIATLTIFSIPSLKSLPASRSLPQIRWLFSRGSHIFPTAAALSSAGFFSLSFFALPTGQRTLSHLLSGLLKTGSVQGYAAAAILCISIGPFTSLMVPTNFEMIRMNEEKGGTRSQKSAVEEEKSGGKASDGKKDKALASISGEGQASQFSDLSGPQGKVGGETNAEDDEKVEKLLATFGTMNMVRAVLIGAGGIVGLLTAMA